MGTIYLRKDGMWCAAVELPATDGRRRRKVIASKDRAVVEGKMNLLKEVENIRPVAIPRSELMKEAQKLGTHTALEWRDVFRAAKNCRYCETELNSFNTVKDHMIAVGRGGSDAIDNIQAICWECNSEKGPTPHDQYTYLGVKPRPFSPLPQRRGWWEEVRVARLRFGRRRNA